MQDLYDILGVPRSAANKEINAALRQLVRRYNEETAQGTRDSTEALKFINRARLAFSDAARRAQYDAELDAFNAEQTSAAAEQAVAERLFSAQQAVNEQHTVSKQHTGGRQRREIHPGAQQRTQSSLDNIIRFDGRFPASQTAVPVKAGKTTAPSTLSLNTRFPTPERPLDPLTFDGTVNPMSLDPVLIPIPMGQEFERMHFPAGPMTASAADADLNSVLAYGDTAEKRSAAPHPTARFSARFIDYALWGVLLWLLLHYLVSAGWLGSPTMQILAGPFLAPVIITSSWALVEALLLIFFPITPGKFLLSIRINMNVSNPYAAADPGAHVAASFARAFRAWWRGMAGGIAPLSLLALFKARKKLLSFKETTWDFDSDCLTTHGKVDVASGLLAVILLLGGVSLYGNQWIPPFWQTVTVGWRSSEAGFAASREMWKVLSGDLPTYGKEIPAAPAKENRTVALEQEAQTFIDQRAWHDLSEHCLAWRQEAPRNASAWFCYGRARHQLADYTGAIAALKQAALLAPQDDDIRRLLRDASLMDMQQKQLRKRQASQEAEPVR